MKYNSYKKKPNGLKIRARHEYTLYLECARFYVINECLSLILGKKLDQHAAVAECALKCLRATKEL